MAEFFSALQITSSQKKSALPRLLALAHALALAHTLALALALALAHAPLALAHALARALAHELPLARTLEHALALAHNCATHKRTHMHTRVETALRMWRCYSCFAVLVIMKPGAIPERFRCDECKARFKARRMQ